MARLFWLSRPGRCSSRICRVASRGKPRVDDRRVISGILHLLKAGGRWRDVLPEYRPAATVYNRYIRWSRRWLWQRVFEQAAVAGPVPRELLIDSTHAKAHRSAS